MNDATKDTKAKSTKDTKDTPDCEYLRASKVPDRFPVLSRSRWMQLIASGEIPSRAIGRARIVTVADVVTFLEGKLQGKPAAS